MDDRTSRALHHVRWALRPVALLLLPATQTGGCVASDTGEAELSVRGVDDAPGAARLRCREVTFQVALTPEGPADQEMAARLCTRGSLRGKTIQLVIHGATFDHNYWDFPLEPETYSYTRHMTRAGYAVLNLDRIGYGDSSHPEDGRDVTLHTGAFTIHQVVQELRSGQMVVPGLGRVRAERIQLVGSSMGSFISVIEASSYGDVDGVVLTSYSHTVGEGGVASFGLVIPAQEDPKFADFPFINYLSEAPGAREFLFYHLPNIDPDVAELDTALRQTWTVGELEDIIPSLLEPIGIQVPTLIVVGDFDTIACNLPCSETGSLDGEAALYPPEACAEVAIIPDAGHALSLHRNAPDFFAVVEEWSDRRVGASTRSEPPELCP